MNTVQTILHFLNRFSLFGDLFPIGFLLALPYNVRAWAKWRGDDTSNQRWWQL